MSDLTVETMTEEQKSSTKNLLDGKKVTLELVGLDSNAFSIMGALRDAMRKEGWPKNERDVVMAQLRSGDYNHLLATALSYTQSPQAEPEAEEEGDEGDWDSEEYWDQITDDPDWRL